MELRFLTNYYSSKMEWLRTCKITDSLIDGIPNVAVQNGAPAGLYVTPEALSEEYLSTVVLDVNVLDDNISQTIKRTAGNGRYAPTVNTVCR